MCRFWNIVSIALAVAFLIPLGTPTDVSAVSHTTAFKAPLTPPYERCGEELSTTDCATGSMDLISPWIYSQGTIVIDGDEVSLRLDDIRLRDGFECEADVGDATACNCWDDPNGVCAANGLEDCESTFWCGPNANDDANNNYFKVVIYFQDYFDYWGPSMIRRSVGCHRTIDFDLKNNTGNNQNRQVNQTFSTTIGCGFGSRAFGAEIRHVEVLDKWGNVVGRTTY